MGFGWALTDLLMADDVITADRIQTLNQHEQFEFINCIIKQTKIIL